MRADWESHLQQWTAADVVDAATAARIRAWEGRETRSQGLRWPVLIALTLGALLIGAGVLLFVSAHWDELSPSGRIALVLLMVGVFHGAGAAAAVRFEGLAITLHTVGTFALGAGIALAGQIFNLAEHWPSAFLLWAAGAALAWALLRPWTQAALTAFLVPYWLAGEWWVRMRGLNSYYSAPAAAGICALSFTYLSARRGPADGALRKVLCWLGGIALLPAAAYCALDTTKNVPSWQQQAPAWAVAVLGPMAVAVSLRGRGAVFNGMATAWSVLLTPIAARTNDPILVYLWLALGAVGLSAWGIRESRPERINLGMAGFALTVLGYYFSSVMDKLGRSASLMFLGILFLGGGWLMERMRRRLIAQIRPEAL